MIKDNFEVLLQNQCRKKPKESK